MAFGLRKSIWIGLTAGLLSTVVGTGALAQTLPNIRAGLPGRRISGGVRCPCIPPNQPIVAMIPRGNVGKTISDRPSIHFAIPDFAIHHPATFTLSDSQGKVLYKESLDVGELELVSSFQIPNSLLQVEQPYRWVFSVAYEDRHQHIYDIETVGWIQQVSSEEVNIDTTEQASSWKTALRSASNYQQAGLWIDAVGIVANLRQRYPHTPEVQEAWQQMLQDLDVEEAINPKLLTTEDIQTNG